MTDILQIEAAFKAIGGEFVSPVADVAARLKGIKAVIFDWDGVFNDGYKGETAQSGFSEPDAMGINMLRLSHFLDGQLLLFAFMSGQTNASSFHFARREHISAVYMNVLNKTEALDHFGRAFLIKPEEVLFVYDDLLDLSIARRVGLRVCVRHKAQPMLADYIRRNGHADYITGCHGGEYAVREMVELLISLRGNFDQVCSTRVDYNDDYQRFLSAKKMVSPQFFRKEHNMISQVNMQY